MPSEGINGPSPVSEIFSGLQDFFKLQGKSLQLKFYRTATDSLARATRSLALVMAGLFALLFLSAGAAFLLSAKTGSYALGFALVGLIYLLLLALVALYMNRRKGDLRDRILRQLTGNEQGYEQLVNEDVVINLALAKRKQELTQTLAELQEALKKLESRFGPLLKTETPKEGEPPNRTSTVLAGIADFLISTFVLPKAGLVKRLVVPAVTKAVFSSALIRDGRAAGFLNRLKRRFFK